MYYIIYLFITNVFLYNIVFSTAMCPHAPVT